MTKWELIICFMDHTWTTDIVETNTMDSEADVHQMYTEVYCKRKTAESKEIAYVGTYHVEDIDDEPFQIGWQPSIEDYNDDSLLGLPSFAVYRDLENGKKDFPDVKQWIPIYDGDIEGPTIVDK